MNATTCASLSDALLVAKGTAAPSCAPNHKQRRGRLDDIRVRVALRLDEPRHRRLRLAAAHMHKSAQAVMLAALDHYLERIVANALAEPCPCLQQARLGHPDHSPLQAT
jgi:hypothetical protein